MWGAVLALAVIGVVLGVLLAAVARRFHVQVDPLIEQVADVLPGANCGGCGFAGCTAFAEAVATGGASASLCGVGGGKVAEKIDGLLGRTTTAGDSGARLVAVCHCRRRDVKTLNDYRGIPTCRAASLNGLSGGPSGCRYGCLQYGDCIAVCPFGALSRGGEGQPIVVDEAKCVGCRRCEKACPRGLFSVEPLRRTAAVGCRNRDKGPQAHQICAHACIACKKCERVCPSDAIHVPNFLAEIDPEKCTQCGKCVEVCPRKTLLDFRVARGMVAPPAETTADVGVSAD